MITKSGCTRLEPRRVVWKEKRGRQELIKLTLNEFSSEFFLSFLYTFIE